MWQMLIPAAASLIGSMIGGSSAKKAARQQAKGQQAAIGTMEQYIGPYAQAGTNALSNLQGFVDQGANFADTQAFKDITNSAKAGGQFGSGNRMTALTDYYATNFRPQRMNELSFLPYMGAQAAGNLATGIGGLQQNIGTAQAQGTNAQGSNWANAMGTIGSMDFSSLLQRNNLSNLGVNRGPNYSSPYTGGSSQATFPNVMPSWFTGS